MNCTKATEADLPFIMEVYLENIEALHGARRTPETWKALLADERSEYYIVRADHPTAWFRLDRDGDTLELGMLQVRKADQRRGIGRYVISAAEAMAKDRGFRQVLIHTTEDNRPAQALYSSAGYALTEIGPCTTADGMERTGYTYLKELRP